jgi:putative DNA methylase
VLELPHQALGFRVQAYGVTQHKDLFTRRQLVALTTFASLIDEVGDRMIGDGAQQDYADAVKTYLSLILLRIHKPHTSCQNRSEPHTKALQRESSFP